MLPCPAQSMQETKPALLPHLMLYCLLDTLLLIFPHQRTLHKNPTVLIHFTLHSTKEKQSTEFSLTSHSRATKEAPQTEAKTCNCSVTHPRDWLHTAAPEEQAHYKALCFQWQDGWEECQPLAVTLLSCQLLAATRFCIRYLLRKELCIPSFQMEEEQFTIT